jgi:diguanylate cyclase (GGDEF)-like protein
MSAHETETPRGRRHGLFTAAQNISLQVDRDGRILRSPAGALGGLGRRASDIEGKNACDLFVGDDALSALALLHRAGRDGVVDATELRMQAAADDDETVVRVTARGNRDGVSVRIRSCGDRERDAFRAAAAARTRFDPLTGLPNRLLLLELAGRALESGPHALVFVDVDRFRHFVTVLGTRVGDRILVELADRLVATSGPGGIVGISGGRFALLTPGRRDQHELEALLVQVHDAIRAPLVANGEGIELRACLGAATADSARRVDAWFGEAEAALAQAKTLGPARHAIFHPAFRRRAVREIELESDLGNAVADHELRLDFQPIVELVADTVVGYEALVRWQHPNRGLLAPKDFLGIAQRTGAGAAIDDWVLIEACRRGACGAAPGATGTICVNVTPERFAIGGLAERVERALTTTGLDARRLVIEITEWSLLDAASAADTLAALNELGVRVALDDYGTGYSSLADLAELAVDEIKIDMSFVAGLGSDRVRTAIVHAIIGLGHALGIAIVAEGVETEAQAFSLRALGCEFAQGFHFGRPAPYPVPRSVDTMTSAGVG